MTKKFLVLAVGLASIALYAKSVDTQGLRGEERMISAFGDADFGKGVAHSVCSFKDFVLSANQIDNLNATPVKILDSPGAGKAIIPCSAVAWMNYAGTAWAGSSENINIIYGTAGATALQITEAFVENTKDSYGVFPAATITDGGAMDNQDIYVKASADFTTGNSPLQVRFYYRTIGGSLILGSSLLP